MEDEIVSSEMDVDLKAEKRAAMEFQLEKVAENLRTQDNLATALPMFVVQQKRRIYGMDTKWADEICWTNVRRAPL